MRPSRLLRVVRVVAIVVFALLALICAPFVLLQFAPVRAFGVSRALRYVNTLSDYQVRIASLTRLDPFGLSARGIEVSREGELSIRVSALSLTLSPWSLLRGEVHVSTLEIDHVRGFYRLVPSESEEEDEAEAEGAPLEVRVEGVSLRDVQLESSGLGPMTGLRIDALEGAFALGAAPWALLSRAELRAEADGQRLLSLSTKQGRWTAADGGAIRLEGHLADAPLTLTSELPPLERAGLWPEGSARLELRDVTPQDVARLGLEADLRTQLSLGLTVVSHGDSVEASLEVESAQVALSLRAEAEEGRASGKLKLEADDLQAVSGLLPELSVRTELDAQVVSASSMHELSLRFRDSAVAGFAIPDGQLEATYSGATLALERLSFVAFGEALEASAIFNLETNQGRVDLALRALELSALPLEGMPRGEVTGQLGLTLGANEQLEGGGELRLTALELADAKLRQALLSLRVQGTLERPRLALTLDADGLAASGVEIDRLEIQGDGTRESAELRLSLRAPTGWLSAELEVAGLSRPRQEAQLAGRGAFRAIPITFSAGGERLPSGALGLSLALRADAERVTAQAELDARERLRASLTAKQLDLSRWTSLFGVEGVSGTLGAELSAAGPMASPEVTAGIRVRGLSVPHAPTLEVTLDASSSLARGEGELHADVSSAASDLTLALDGRVSIPKQRGKLAYEELRYDAKLGAALPVSLLTAYGMPTLDALAGGVALDVDATGTLTEPEIDARVDARVSLRAHPDLPPERLELGVHLDPSSATLEARLTDLQGPLLDVQANVALGEGELRTRMASLGLDNLPETRVTLELERRRLDQLQGVVAYLTGLYATNLPAEVSASVQVSASGTKLDGSARARAIVFGDVLDNHCAVGARSSVDVTLELGQNDLVAKLVANTDRGGRLSAEASTRLLLGEERVEGRFISGVGLRAEGREISLHTLPGLCDLTEGTLAFDFDARALDGPLEAGLDVGLDRLRAASGGPLSASLSARARGDLLQATGELRADHEDAGSYRARIPLRYDEGAAFPQLAMDAPVHVRLTLTHAPIGPFMSFGEGLGRPSGRVDGSASLTGTLSDPHVEGRLALEDVSFSIASLAQPLRDIDGVIVLRDRNLRIEKLTAHDADGTLRLDGSASLAADSSGEAKLRVRSDDFPLRRQGQILGKLTTDVSVDAALDTQKALSVAAVIDGGRLWLTGKRGRDVQPLEEHPDVRYVDRPEQAEAPGEAESTTLALTLSQLTVRSEKRLWIMHKDFSVQIGVDVALEQREQLALKGEATIHRGELTLLGSAFQIDEGAIRFTGDFPPDPALELHAVYKRSRGEDLWVDVTGRSSAPVVTFRGAASNAGEAMAVLSGVGRGGAESQAQSDAANFAASLTAALLSVTIREEFGDWVPVIVVETDDSGAVSGARAGFDASDLIPPFLQGIARGAYVEGIVSGTEQRGGGVGLGARLEIALPHDFITSTGYGPGATWSADFAWAP